MVSLFLLLGCNLSYIVDLFAALHELASAGACTLLKLAPSVRALLKPYGDTLRAQIVTFHREPKHFELSTAVTVRWILHALTAGLINCHKLSHVITQFVLIWHVSQRISAVNLVSLKEI